MHISPVQRRAEPLLAVGDEAVGIGAGDAGLLRLVADIDLHEQAGRAAFVRCDRGGDGVGEARAVEALDDVGDAHRVARLVGLQPADEVQAQVRLASAQAGEFAGRFLDAVLAERS